METITRTQIALSVDLVPNAAKVKRVTSPKRSLGEVTFRLTKLTVGLVYKFTTAIPTLP